MGPDIKQYTIIKQSFTVFKRSEKYLLNNPGFRNGQVLSALLQENTDKYRSLMDCIFCELFPEWKEHCLKYYEGKGPKLKEILSETQIRKYDELIVDTLRMLKKITEWISDQPHRFRLVKN